jgi:hypothetical protein
MPVAVQLDELEASGPCSAARWPVKTLTDPGVSALDLTPVATSVSDLGAIRPPVPAPVDGTPRLASETQVAAVTASLYVDHLEADLDIHLVLHDPAKPNASMIAELPDPRCTTKAPPALRTLMTQAREAYVSACGPASGDQGNYFLNATAQVTGVRLFDTIVGQFGRAPNAIELHPILGFKILGPCRKMGGSTRFGLTSSITEGSTIQGTIDWSATASAGSAGSGASLEFLVDGTRVSPLQTGSQATVSVDTRTFVDGPHSFGVRARLADGSTTLLVNHVQTANGTLPRHPSLIAKPARLRAGTPLVITLHGFVPATKVVARVARSARGWASATGVTTADGSARLRLAIPRSAPAGTYTVTACQRSCAVTAAGRLTVRR